MNNIYQHKPLKERQDTPLVLNNSVIANDDASAKRNVACRSGNTLDSRRPNIGIHTVFVLNSNGKPLSPTTPAKARKLLKGGVAKKIWSKFNTFGIKMKINVKDNILKCTLGIDNGAKYEGYSVVCGSENNISIKLNLPNKNHLVKKIKLRSLMRRFRRGRLRRRQERFQNRSRFGFIAPSQNILIQSRLKIISEICNLYPIICVAIENVCFNHNKSRKGKYFSAIEIGKNIIRKWFNSKNIQLVEFMGFETYLLRNKYGYIKTNIKSLDKFESHCSDSLTLAIEINTKKYITPGTMIIVDDSYRCIRRRLHDYKIQKGGIREKYSTGTILNLKKGLLIGVKNGTIGRLCGKVNQYFYYHDSLGKRKRTSKIIWISNHWRTAIAES